MNEVEEESEGGLAAALVELAARLGSILVIARSESRAGRLAQAARALAPDVATHLLPGWDCLP
ncbi:MAG: Transcription-repair-coupling factor, partial [Rubritepida sp.]|nr:Transcription-repair-coupling factor [Rubritepida sp.]